MKKVIKMMSIEERAIKKTECKEHDFSAFNWKIVGGLHFFFSLQEFFDENIVLISAKSKLFHLFNKKLLDINLWKCF